MPYAVANIEKRRERDRINQARRRAANPERGRRACSEWAKRNREQINAKARGRYALLSAEERRRILDRNKAYLRENAQQARERAAKWRAANKPHLAEMARKARAKDPARHNLRSWRTSFKSRYGITLADRDRMAERQNGLCAICGRLTKLCIDHDHKTGVVRELLCHQCNAAIGMFRDDPELARKAALYLEKHKENK